MAPSSDRNGKSTSILLSSLSLNASQIVLLSFGLFILFGTILLALPICHERPHALVDDLFMAASAVCVTGLTTIDPAQHYSFFGELVLMFLIQIGGLGYMTLFTAGMVIIGKRISMRDRLNIQEATDQPGMMGLIGYLINVLRLTVVVESAGALALATQTIPEAGWAKGAYLAVFHAVSAFNNAGFALYADNAVHWQQNAVILMILAGLVIVGGLGYNVNMELVRRLLLRRKPQVRWNILLKLVLGMSAILLVFGTGVIWFFESRNPQTLGDLPLHSQLVNSFFMSAMPRTAGYNSVDVGLMARPCLLMIMLFMFVGAGPGGTAGGIKLTTVAVLLATVHSAIRGEGDVNLLNFRRRISDKLVRKAVAVLFLSGLTVMIVTFLIASVEPFDFLPVLFEVVSAFGTVGLTMGITTKLTAISKLLLVLTMFAGRVGVLFIMLALYPARKKSVLHYEEEPLLVG